MSQLQNSTNMTNKTHVNNMLQSWVGEEIEHNLVSTNSSNTVKPRYLETTWDWLKTLRYPIIQDIKGKSLKSIGSWD